LLQEGARRTPHKKQELIRITLRRYLPKVIEAEAAQRRRRPTNIEPWPKAILEKAYRRVGKEWDAIEEAATRAQGKPGFNDLPATTVQQNCGAEKAEDHRRRFRDPAPIILPFPHTRTKYPGRSRMVCSHGECRLESGSRVRSHHCH